MMTPMRLGLDDRSAAVLRFADMAQRYDGFSVYVLVEHRSPAGSSFA